jgi:thermitase
MKAEGHIKPRHKKHSMREKIQAFLQRFKSRLMSRQAHSKVLIIGGFSILFIALILLTVRARVSQENQANTQLSPTPFVLQPGKDYVEGQINVKFAEGMTDQEIDSTLAPHNARIKSTITGINVKVVEVPVGKEQEITKKLIEQGVVKYAELNFTGRAVVDPNDTHFGLQYGLKNTGQDIKGQKGTPNSDIRAEGAWNVSKGDGVKVAIVDTGIDLNHPEFAGKIVAHKSFVSEPTAEDGNGHGTHVAGTVTANTNNEQGVAGTCPNCQLVIAKALGDNGSGDVAGISNGVTWAADNGPKVINISVVMNNGVAPEPLKDAINYAWNKGIVIVAAAGNCGDSNYTSNGCSVMNQQLYPAAFPNVVSVANIDNKDQKHSSSNHGTWVDVAAYGTHIVATLPTHQNAFGILNYGYLTGTSMASPMVAGVAGLVWSSPHGTSNQAVVDRLLSTVDNISGTGTYWEKGRINAEEAVGGGNRQPVGVVDEYSCSKVRGWSYDPDEPGKSIAVHVYINGAVGTPNAEGHDTGETSVNRPDVNSARGISGVHGFDWALPDKYRDGKSHEVFVYAIDSQGGTNPEIGRGNTGNCPSSDTTPTVTNPPSVTISPSAGPSPTLTINPTITEPPPFVCGGSPDNICTSPTVTLPPDQPVEECLDPRGTTEKINDWVSGFLLKVKNYINAVVGNPQQPPPPPVPCILQ